MALAERAELVARLSLKDDFSAKLRGADKALKGLDKSFGRTQSSLAKTGANLARLGAIAAGAAAGGLVAVVKIAADFESQLNTINTIARATPTELGKIGDSIRKIARDSGTPLADLTQAYYDLLSAGVAAADAPKVLTAANTLAIGALSTTAEAVDLLTTAINVYGGDATKAAGYADIFAKAVERGKVTADEIAASFSQVGNIAAASGLEIEEIAAAFARLTAGGTAAAEVTTQMRAAIKELAVGGPELAKLEKATKKSYLAIAGSKGLVVALEEMRVDAAKAGVPFIDLFGRIEGFSFALATTGPNFAAYTADLAAMGDAAGTAAGQMGERQKGLNFALSRLKALAMDAGITIGSALLPKLVPLIEKLNTFISANQGGIADFGGKLAQGFEDFAAAVGKVDWQPFIDGLTITGGIAKEAIRLFMSLPPDVQKLAIAALAVNKVTGGLGTSIVKDLAGLALGGLRTITAASVTVIGASVTGGGLPGAVPGGKGGIGGALGTAAKIILPAAAVAAGLAAGIEATGINDPRHQFQNADGTTRTVRATNVPSEQIANLMRSLDPLRQRAAGGDRDALRKLAAIEAEIARLRGEISRTQTGGLSPEERQVANDQRKAVDRVWDAIERNRITIAARLTDATQVARYAGQQTAAAIRDRAALNVTVNVSTSVTVRDSVRQSVIAAKYGLVAS